MSERSGGNDLSLISWPVVWGIRPPRLRHGLLLLSENVPMLWAQDSRRQWQARMHVQLVPHRIPQGFFWFRPVEAAPVVSATDSALPLKQKYAKPLRCMWEPSFLIAAQSIFFFRLTPGNVIASPLHPISLSPSAPPVAKLKTNMDVKSLGFSLCSACSLRFQVRLLVQQLRGCQAAIAFSRPVQHAHQALLQAAVPRKGPPAAERNLHRRIRPPRARAKATRSDARTRWRQPSISMENLAGS